MWTIYKYPLAMLDEQTIMIPGGAQLLSVQVQHGVPCVWALVDPVKDKQKVKFRIFGTGHSVPPRGIETMTYFGTIQMADGDLVFHVFHGH